MADRDRYGAYDTDDRQRSRYGSDTNSDGDSGRDRDDRSRHDSSRGSMFGSGRGREEADRFRDQSRNRDYGYDDRHEGLPIDETGRLIGSNKVEGTAVYARDGARLGSIYNFMVDKRSGKAEYAVMTYGGFMGMGTRYYPLPWDLLEYDTRLGGYHVQMLERDLERAPSFDRQSEPQFDRRYGERVRSWYGLRT